MVRLRGSRSKYAHLTDESPKVYGDEPHSNRAPHYNIASDFDFPAFAASVLHGPDIPSEAQLITDAVYPCKLSLGYLEEFGVTESYPLGRVIMLQIFVQVALGNKSNGCKKKKDPIQDRIQMGT